MTPLWPFWYQSVHEAPNWSQLFENNERESSTKQLIHSFLPSGKPPTRLLSKRDVSHIPADRNEKLPTQDVLTNKCEEAERREPMSVTVEHYADRRTAKHIDKPRKKQKQRNSAKKHKKATEY